ncbi:MAG TPA: glutamate--tRNA ligase [Candidatus Paceibacterota bacterium]|nr:glutamate--tRNA ligase [Candidatus Paceibacterota bacterium]
MSEKNNQKVVTRFAPSPTGVLHIGNTRTAFFNYLFAKKYDGKFILRVEDTDTERSKKEYEENIKESMNWLGLDYDEFYRQSDRSEIYKEYLQKLIDSGNAYISKESTGDRTEVIRFKNPNKKITFDDMIRGPITFDTQELGDFVIAKSLTEPLYHLAVVVDDHQMGITHIIRGEDGISNTPRQILIQDGIGAIKPKYAHLPLILGQDKSKLSKRHGAVSITEYRNLGYIKEAILNHLAMLSWNPGTDQEIFTMNELIKEFSVEKINKSAAVFNIEKLDWFNKEHLKKVDQTELNNLILEKLKRISGFDYNNAEKIQKLLPIIKERLSKISDIDKMISDGELEYFFNLPKYEIEKIIWKKSDKKDTIEYLSEILSRLQNSSEDNFSSTENIKNIIWDYAEQKGRGQVLWPLRFSLSGREKSPDPFTLVFVLGKTDTINRIKIAISNLNEE